MESFKFVHAADIHLDSPLSGLQRYEGAPVTFIRLATRKAFENLVDYCIDEKVNFLLLAGDLYDGEWKDYNTGLFFASQMSRLKREGIKVFIVKGNHDAASQISRNLRLPDNVTVFSAGKPGTAKIETLKVAVHGQSFANQSVTEDLSRNYPQPVNNFFNVGLLHTCANGREGHDNYAPCDINYLTGKGYDYWALGHVHKREILSEDPYIVFPGNIQGRNIRERGAKGCTLVEVKEGHITGVKDVHLDVLRWVLLEVDLSDLEKEEELLRKVSLEIEELLSKTQNRFLAIRIVLSGATSLHQELKLRSGEFINNIRVQATDIAGESIWVEKINISTKGLADREKLLSYPPTASLLEFIDNLSSNEEFFRELIQNVEDFKTALPPEFFSQTDSFLNNEDTVREILPEIGDMLVTRILATFSEEVV